MNVLNEQIEDAKGKVKQLRGTQSMSLQRISLWLPYRLSFEALEGMELCFLSCLPAGEHLAICTMDTQRIIIKCLIHWGGKAILNHKERVNQTQCGSQWKNTASSEKQSCPQIKPEPDCGYWPK